MPLRGEGAAPGPLPRGTTSSGTAPAGSVPSEAEPSHWTDATLSADTGMPLYIQIRNLLREQIRLGEWSAYEPMPTEDELVNHFGVSRTTVRQAMADLVNEGLVVRKAGRGTFARQPLLVLRMQQWHSVALDIVQRGLRSSKLTLSLERLDARTEIAHRASEIAEGDVLHLKQVRYADDLPIVVLDHYFPFERCGFLADMPVDEPNFSIQQALGRHGIELHSAKGEISATTATELEAKYLQVPPGTPLVEIATKTYDRDGRVVEYSRGVVQTGRYPIALYSDWKVESDGDISADGGLAHG
jgi:GntR family transcriptional regulator